MAAKKLHPQTYVAIGKGGLLKVGFTKDFDARLKWLRRDFKAKGDVIAQHAVFPRIEAAYSVEMNLIRHCSEKYEQHSGREWFKNGNFAEVVQAAERINEQWKNHRYPKPLSEERIAELRAQRLAEAQRVAASRAAREALRLKRSAALRAKRMRAQRVLEQIVAFALGNSRSPSLPL